MGQQWIDPTGRWVSVSAAALEALIWLQRRREQGSALAFVPDVVNAALDECRSPRRSQREPGEEG